MPDIFPKTFGYVTFALYKDAALAEKSCHAHMKATVPRYNAQRWALVEVNDRNSSAAFYVDSRVASVIPKVTLDAAVSKLSDTGFPSVRAESALNPVPWVPNPPPVNDPVKDDSILLLDIASQPAAENPPPVNDPVIGDLLPSVEA